MALIEFDVKDLESLIGRSLTKEEITEKIPMMGFPLEKLENGKAFFEVFPNRPDMLSVEGFARSIRSFFGIDEKPSYNFKKSGIKIIIDKSVKKVRPFAVSATVHNVKLTDQLLISLMQVQEKLHDTLGRKRRKVAIGIHDMDKVKPPFVYKAVVPEEISFVPLDMDKKMNLSEICKNHPKGIKYAAILKDKTKWPIIVDKKGEVLSFPPIINGDLTRVTENTRNIFIDVTGTDQKAVNQALNILTALFHERGCKVETVEVVDVKKLHTPITEPIKIKLNIDYACKLLGISLTKNQVNQLLGKMGIDYGTYVSVPYYRTDIMHQIDIVEELAIAYGYQNFQPEIPEIATISSRLLQNEFSAVIRESMIGEGFQEVICMVLTNQEDEFEKMNRPKEDVCETANPLTVECTMCRKNILPSLMRVMTQNKNKEYPQKIFEVGHVIIPDSTSETGATNLLKIGCALSDVKAGYEDISPVLDALMRSIGISYKLKKAEHPSFIEGRSAWVEIAGKPIGIIGEINPEAISRWKIEKPVAAFELNAEDIMNNKRK